MSNTKTNPNDLVSAYGYANDITHFDSLGGLTKREHFAAMAMQALCSQEGVWNSQPNDIIAKHAVSMADALIEQLNKQA